MTTALANEYRLERIAQDARFDARIGAGSVDHTMTGTEEYRAYFGLGEYMGHGVETRVTFRSFLIARARERRAETEAAERARLAELPTHFLTELAGIPAIDAELERRAAEWDDAHAFEPAFDVEAEIAEILEDADTLEPLEVIVQALEALEALEVVEIPATLARVATRCYRPRAATAAERRTQTVRRFASISRGGREPPGATIPAQKGRADDRDTRDRAGCNRGRQAAISRDTTPRGTDPRRRLDTRSRPRSRRRNDTVRDSARATASVWRRRGAHARAPQTETHAARVTLAGDTLIL